MSKNVVYWLYDDTCINPISDGYVGITRDLAGRLRVHRSSGRTPPGFKVQVLYEGTREECAAMERQYRPRPNIGWNISSGGHGGQIASEATRLLQRAAKLGKKQSPETITKRTLHQKGRALSIEHRAKLSVAARGKPKLPEHRAKLAEANRGKKLSPQTCEKLSAVRRGKKKSKAHRESISKAITLWHARRAAEMEGSRCH